MAVYSEGFPNFNFLDEDGTIKVDQFNIADGGKELEGVMIKEILMTESLLTPSPQMAVILHSTIYDPDGKNFDKWKSKDIKFTLTGKLKTTDGKASEMKLEVQQKVYRLSDRKFMPTNVGQTEQMTVHACDETLFKDAQKLVSKSWKCTQPHKIVKDILEKCVEAKVMDIQEADPTRDYIAENIHPYQVIAQQANVALDGGDPSFVHFMTYEEKGKHYFKSLKKMASVKDAAHKYIQVDVERTTGYENNTSYAINFMFPCDFDYLSDLLNGVNEQGQDQNTGGFWNLVNKVAGKMGSSDSGGCSSLGGYNYKEANTNKGTAEQQNSCNLDVESHLLKRQARMGLLDRDKIALRITVPCNLNLHAGQVIELKWDNKLKPGTPVYGSGKYLIASMTHNIKLGGFSVTTMDCVASSVSSGEV